jgi:hypothetical protein
VKLAAALQTSALGGPTLSTRTEACVNITAAEERRTKELETKLEATEKALEEAKAQSSTAEGKLHD